MRKFIGKKVMNVYFEQLRQRCLAILRRKGPFSNTTIHTILCYAERSYLSFLWRLSRPRHGRAFFYTERVSEGHNFHNFTVWKRTVRFKRNENRNFSASTSCSNAGESRFLKLSSRQLVFMSNILLKCSLSEERKLCCNSYYVQVFMTAGAHCTMSN